MTVSNLLCRWLGRAVPIFAIAFAAGCVPPDYLHPRVYYDEMTPQWREIAVAESMVSFQGKSPDVVMARQRSYGRQLKVQELVLDNRTMTAGQNSLRIAIEPSSTIIWRIYDATGTRHAAAGRRENDLEPTAESIAEAFNGASFEISTAMPYNRYGLYGYAETTLGERPRCVLVWQHVSDNERVLPATIQVLHLRFRFCDPLMSTAQMLDVFNSLLLTSPINILPQDRYIQPRPIDIFGVYPALDPTASPGLEAEIPAAAPSGMPGEPTPLK